MSGTGGPGKAAVIFWMQEKKVSVVPIDLIPPSERQQGLYSQIKLPGRLKPILGFIEGISDDADELEKIQSAVSDRIDKMTEESLCNKRTRKQPDKLGKQASEQAVNIATGKKKGVPQHLVSAKSKTASDARASKSSKRAAQAALAEEVLGLPPMKKSTGASKAKRSVVVDSSSDDEQCSEKSEVEDDFSLLDQQPLKKQDERPSDRGLNMYKSPSKKDRMPKKQGNKAGLEKQAAVASSEDELSLLDQPQKKQDERSSDRGLNMLKSPSKNDRMPKKLGDNAGLEKQAAVASSDDELSLLHQPENPAMESPSKETQSKKQGDHNAGLKKAVSSKQDKTQPKKHGENSRINESSEFNDSEFNASGSSWGNVVKKQGDESIEVTFNDKEKATYFKTQKLKKQYNPSVRAFLTSLMSCFEDDSDSDEGEDSNDYVEVVAPKANEKQVEIKKGSGVTISTSAKSIILLCGSKHGPVKMVTALVHELYQDRLKEIHGTKSMRPHVLKAVFSFVTSHTPSEKMVAHKELTRTINNLSAEARRSKKPQNKGKSKKKDKSASPKKTGKSDSAVVVVASPVKNNEWVCTSTPVQQNETLPAPSQGFRSGEAYNNYHYESQPWQPNNPAWQPDHSAHPAWRPDHLAWQPDWQTNNSAAWPPSQPQPAEPEARRNILTSL